MFCIRPRTFVAQGLTMQVSAYHALRDPVRRGHCGPPPPVCTSSWHMCCRIDAS